MIETIVALPIPRGILFAARICFAGFLILSTSVDVSADGPVKSIRDSSIEDGDSDKPAGLQASIRGTIRNALPAIVSGGESWIKTKDCLSCHRVSFMVWSLNRAQETGFDVDPDRLDQWNDWASNWKNLINPKRRAETSEEDILRKESDTVAQMLIGRRQDDEKQGWVMSFQSNLRAAQKEDGSWDPVGQLPKQKRPARETREVTTMWTLLGLHAVDKTASLEPVVERSEAWISGDKQGISTEWWATRLLTARMLGEADQAETLRRRLLKSQHKDGGWGWLTKDESDALGTSIALYALAKDGLTTEHDSIAKAIKFLRATQKKDGSWDVKGTKSGYKNRVTDTASYWGTCWSVIALTELLESDPRE